VTDQDTSLPVDDLRNIFLKKRGHGEAKAPSGDEYGLILDNAMLSGIFRVVATAMVTPHMKRITIAGDRLQALRGKWAPTLEVRGLFPSDGGEVGPEGPVSFPSAVHPLVRTYTARSFDDERATMDIDFVIHEEGGVGSRWAASAAIGDRLALALRYPEASPRDHGADWYLLVGDETAVPAIASIIETMPVGRRVVAFIEVADTNDEQPFASGAEVAVTWLYRGDDPAGTSPVVDETLRRLDWPDGRVFAFVAGEVRMVSAVRRYLREEKGLTRHDYKIQAYWRRGMTEVERLDKIKEASAKLMAAGVDVVEIYNERGMAGDDPTLSDG
jgi:NADPH-dependent ferric siderophore reductase